MDPKQCLLDVEQMIDNARATKVRDHESYRLQKSRFQEARQRLNEYTEWRAKGGFEPMFPTFKGGKEDIGGDFWAKHFADVLHSFGA